MAKFARLWGVAPVWTTNILERNIQQGFNPSLTEAAVSAFEDYRVTHRSAASSLHQSTASNIRSSQRRKRNRPLTTAGLTSSVPPSPTKASNDGVTDNDFFFEHQRIHGYRLATNALANSFQAQQLEELIADNICPAYLNAIGTSRATQVAQLVKDPSRWFGRVEMWAAIQQGQGAYHGDHVHEGVLISGVYYSSVPTGSAPLVLRKPGTPSMELLLEDSSPINADHHVGEHYDFVEPTEEGDIHIHPQEGQIVLFPPWIMHGVPRQEDASTPTTPSRSYPRVSFAFNLNGGSATGAGAWGGDPWDVTRLQEPLQG